MGECRPTRCQKACGSFSRCFYNPEEGSCQMRKLQRAADKACLDARACPQASKRLQELLAQHGLPRTLDNIPLT